MDASFVSDEEHVTAVNEADEGLGVQLGDF
jgi:hypothetical protein